MSGFSEWMNSENPLFMIARMPLTFHEMSFMRVFAHGNL